MPLKVGDLVWYNVGGRGYETVGLVIETADLWRDKSMWENEVRKYANCVRIQWMRTGKLKPRTITLPLYRATIRARWDDNLLPTGFVEWERESILSKMGTIETGEWYEGHFFKPLGEAKARRK